MRMNLSDERGASPRSRWVSFGFSRAGFARRRFPGRVVMPDWQTGERIGKSVALDVLRGFERLTLSLVPEERRRAA